MSMLAHARVAKVPPEWVSSSTTLFRKEWLSPWKGKPACNHKAATWVRVRVRVRVRVSI